MSSLQQIYTDAQTQWSQLQETELTVFFVGAATCGRAAGATDVLERLRSHIKKRKIKASVIEVGCLGPCSFEPLVIVQKSGAPSICYANIGPDEIIHILENYVLGDDPCSKWALGTLTPGKLNGIGDFNEHPMMRRQVRNILRNCGLIDTLQPDRVALA
jgi:NADH-quinone oxidoreductase subunit F